MTDKTISTVEELSSSLKYFGVLDYLAVLLMLGGCGVIGVYFGFLEKKTLKAQKNGCNKANLYMSNEELNYLVGGRKMKTFPIAISLIASWVSGIALLGTSTEVYVYGVNYVYTVISLCIVSMLARHIYIPVFHELQVTSVYEYLELRFSKGVRRLGSVMFCFCMMAYLPIVIFVPALAFNQITGVSIHVLTPIVCSICIFYTCVGGIKAVVWTDVLQAGIMIAAVVAVMIKGTISVGGVGVVWQRNLESGRLDLPPATLDPTIRYSLFSLFGGGVLYWIQSSVSNQAMMQRYSSLPSLRSARAANLIFIIGLGSLIVSVCYNGLVIYAMYHDCDPLTTKLAAAKDQLVPLMVMQLFGDTPAFPGFFISGVLCAALSSLSTGLNCLSAVVLEDLWKPFMKTTMTERQTAIVMRLIVIVFGLYCFGMVFVVEKLGTVLALANTLSAISMGPECGLYMIGMFLPWINKKGALTGCVVSLFTMAYVCLRCQLSLVTGEFKWPEYPVSTEGCTYNFTMPKAASLEQQPSEDGFRPISYLFFIGMGSIITVVVASISSLIYGLSDPKDVDTKLLAPMIRKFFKSREYLTVQTDVKDPECDMHELKVSTKRDIRDEN